MPAIARINDECQGKCSAPGHSANRDWTGVIETGSDTYESSGQKVARTNDTGVTDCPVPGGHHFRITGGSSIHEADGRPVARVGDAVEIIEGDGFGTITSGSSIHESN